MAVQLAQMWSKSYSIRPRDNIQSHELINAKKFVPSYDKHCCPTLMCKLLRWEYGRKWLEDRQIFQKQIDKEKPKPFRNDYDSWLKKRKPKAKNGVKHVNLHPKAKA